MLHTLSLLLLAVLAPLIAAQGFNRYDAALHAVCDHMLDVYQQGLAEETCESVDGCDSNLKSLLSGRCNSEYGNEEPDCNCSGRRISRNLAVTRLAPGSSSSDSLVKRDICLSKNLHEVFNDQMMANPGILYIYAGFFSGVMRTYPTMDWKQLADEAMCRQSSDTCPDYDPRGRPWFIGAAVGRKDLVLVLDLSSSMANGGGVELLQDAAETALTKLSNLDYLGIVAFAGGEVKRWHSTLQPAKSVNRADALTFVRGIAPEGSPDFGALFEATFELIRESRGSASSDCKTAILFISGGRSNTSPMGQIKSFHSQEPKTFIFSYTIGSNADLVLARRIACSTGGVYTHLDDGVDLMGAMTSYFNLFSVGRGGSQEANQVVWSEPYEDFFGMGTMVSPALKCQAGETLLGVAALDVNMKWDLSVFDEAGLNSRATFCPEFTNTDEELEQIRGHTCDDETDAALQPQPLGKAAVLLPLAMLTPLVCLERHSL